MADVVSISGGRDAKGKAGSTRLALETGALAVTEDSIARVFVEENADRMRFDWSEGCWYQWDGARWKQSKTKGGFNAARRLVAEFDLLCDDADERPRRNSKPKPPTLGMARASVVRGVEAFASADPVLAVTNDVWDADPLLLGTPDGTVDLKTGLIRPAAQADMITKLTAVAPARGRPELWLAFLEQATNGDADLIRFLQQMLGYCLTGLTHEHALFFLHGDGGNGKSVFLNLAEYLLGDYATVAAMTTFTASKFDAHPTELAKLKGARLVTASETESGRAWAEARIKQLTGGDRISARYIGQDFFEFDPNFTLVIVGNHQPVLTDVGASTRRRFNMIPFVHKPKQPDPNLVEKLKAEAPQILQWAIDGWLDMQVHGLIRPAIVAAATAEYFEEQDLFGRWIEECCDRDAEKSETPTALYNSWAAFAKNAGIDGGSQTAMAGKLKREGFDKSKLPGGIRIWKGLSLKMERGFGGSDTDF